MIDLKSLLKYFLEGVAVALAAFYIPRRGMPLGEVLTIAVAAAAMFLVLDLYAPSVAAGARQGTGFAVGAQLAMLGGDNAPAKDSDGESTSSESSSTTSVVDQPAGVDTLDGAGDTKYEPFTSKPAQLSEL